MIFLFLFNCKFIFQYKGIIRGRSDKRSVLQLLGRCSHIHREQSDVEWLMNFIFFVIALSILILMLGHTKQSLWAPTGENTLISVRRTSKVQIEYPYSECKRNIEKSDSILVKSILAKFPRYRHCLLWCKHFFEYQLSMSFDAFY